MKIQFDLKTKELLKKLMMISGVLFLLALIIGLFDIKGLQVFFLFALYIGGAVLIYSTYQYVACLSYFKYLTAYGYELPQDKNEYENDLQNVPKDEAVYQEAMQQPIGTKDSKLLSIVTGAVFLLAVCHDLWFLVYWWFMDDNVVSLTIIQFLYDCIFLIMAIRYNKHRNIEIYQDFLGNEAGIRVRTTFAKGILTVLALLVIGLYGKAMSTSMIKYVFAAQVDADEAIICEIQKAIANASDYTGITLDDGSYELEELENKDRDFVEEIEKSLDVDKLKDCKKDFHVAKGEPKIIVESKNGRYTVSLKNPISRVKEPIVAGGK